MDLIRRQKIEPVIGLHIGSSSIKCVEVTQDKEGIALSYAGIISVADAEPQSLQNSLRTVLKNISGASKNIRISLSGSSILARRIKLPLMTPNELKSAIRFEAEGHIPFPVAECLLEYQILSTNNQEKSMDVLLVAAKKTYVMDWIKVLGDLGVKPELIDIDILSLMNAFEILSDAEKEKPYALLHIGHNASLFAIINEKKPFIVREIPCAGSSITKALAAIRSVTMEQAEIIKKEKTPELEADLQAATSKGLEPLIKELTHSISYFENEADGDLECVWLSGGGGFSSNLETFLSSRLNRKALFWDNTKKIKLLPSVDENFFKANSLAFSVALGLVLRPLR